MTAITKGRILVVDDERAMQIALRGLLTKEGYSVETAGSGEEAIRRIEAGDFHLVITDLSLGGVSGLEVLEHARAFDPDLSVLMITAYGSEKIAVQAMKTGASDYLPKPFDNDELRAVVARLMDTARLRREHRRLLAQVQGRYGLDQIVGRTPLMLRLFESIERVADTDVTVLVRGESGTGKELVANALHYRSPRRTRPLIKVNCAAFSRELVESELFGHERGAFTGAIGQREGKFEAADGGTLFLDEVGDMPLETQAKLLRVIQEKEVERVGGNQPIRIDVRLIAATHHDLEQLVSEGRFREDLYYRLRVIELAVPSLSERREDIPLLIQKFLTDAAERFHRPVKPLSGSALRACMSHPWKGNIRELKSAVEKALLLAAGEEIEAEDLFGRLAPSAAPGARPLDVAALPVSFRDAKQRVVEDFEREFLAAALARNGGNISRTAEEVGMYRQNLQQKIRELGLEALGAIDSADDAPARLLRDGSAASGTSRAGSDGHQVAEALAAGREAADDDDSSR
ncbi:MAG TPA: sigma-54 dependent transcriptional regulator [Candidatus Limnocylindrales bacterium]|nr:sigma-54 dependent transcriptional regulator [Candidatus Limnocylindrales bacterium]